MAEMLFKLSPHRDLQCYFERPSAIAAMSDASPDGYTVSGTWRQQFDWAVIEWNVDNVFEHPAHRCLPDGDLSGLVLRYDETRENCIPMDSDLYPTVDWPYLRLWTRDNGVESFHQVRLRDHAYALEGSYVAASAELTLGGTASAGDYVGISYRDEHHTYQLLGADTLEDAAQAIVDSVNTFSTALTAARTGATIRLEMADATTGANANRLGVYAFASAGATAYWTPWWTRFSGGESPTKWRVTIDFSGLTDINGATVATNKVRKMRWTYAAGMQDGPFARSEFAARITNWLVTGTNRLYYVAGPGSRRIEDDDKSLLYRGTWSEGVGNFSGGSIRYTTEPEARVACMYTSPLLHQIYLGTRYTFNSGTIVVEVDDLPWRTFNLFIPGEDVLCRIPLGAFPPGQHTVIVRHSGSPGAYAYFDFLEIAQPVTELVEFPVDEKLTLATDWDTDHSIALPAERTAWMLDALGYHGRHNLYVGALWFYELVRTGHVYASATVTFAGTPVFSATTTLTIGTAGSSAVAVINHVNRIGDTGETLAKAFELELNRGYTAVRATSSGNVLTIWARAMGDAGEAVTVSASPATGSFHIDVSSATLAGGVDGVWHTDLAASPRINRAARDWCRAFLTEMDARGIDSVAAFSMELQHGDTSVAAGIAQRYANGNPAWLNTPALQTNFSPTSTAFWREVHRDMADVMAEAGVIPYLQFGEVQWWYFPESATSGMPFYDEYTMTQFEAAYSRPMAHIANGSVDPAAHPEEAAFLPALIGSFTDAVIAFVRIDHPDAKFEVLYPNDVNEGAFNRVINYPAAAWTPAKLDNLKTESFTYTFTRNLDKARTTVDYPATRGFTRDKASFLVGLMDPRTAWLKEVNFARTSNVESIVLFALDQFCLMGYPNPLPASLRRCAKQG